MRIALDPWRIGGLLYALLRHVERGNDQQGIDYDTIPDPGGQPMSETLKRCSHHNTLENTFTEYGYTRCRTCRRASNRRSDARRRARFNEQYGYCTAPAA